MLVARRCRRLLRMRAAGNARARLFRRTIIPFRNVREIASFYDSRDLEKNDKSFISLTFLFRFRLHVRFLIENYAIRTYISDVFPYSLMNVCYYKRNYVNK